MLIRVLVIPKSSGKFCFSGGNLQQWVEVDFFRDDWLVQKESPEETQKNLTAFIKQKPYFHESKAFLVLCEDCTFTVGYHAE